VEEELNTMNFSPESLRQNALNRLKTVYRKGFVMQTKVRQTVYRKGFVMQTKVRSTRRKLCTRDVQKKNPGLLTAYMVDKQ
jgi:DNA-binding winged helix-turn-helix (wHTH) protein